MSVLHELKSRVCPVCGSGPEAATLFLEQSIDPEKLNRFSFASRKAPEFMSYRLLRCSPCSTVYAVAAPPSEALAHAYSEASYDGTEEANLAGDTYLDALQPFLVSLPPRARALEIGTGTGVLLERLLGAGLHEVVGVEPSKAAIDAASERVRPFIKEGVFVESEFAPVTFDLICCFQTLEHVSDPKKLTEACARLLRPGGLLAFVTHDYTALVNRLLGRRSPIIDIEHLQLFCRASLDRLLTTSGLTIESLTPLVNRYPLRYWLRLSPFPMAMKSAMQASVRRIGLADLRLSVNVGNLITIARKP